MLEAINVNFDYSDKPLLHNVQFSLPAGHLLHLRGNNGAGKTTLLKLLSGMLRPLSGDIRYQGRSIRHDLATYQQAICYVGHKAGISQLLTVRENCHFALQHSMHAMPFDALLKRFALSGLEDVLCGVLSVGQRRRVGLLRLLMSDASLWLLDEPLVALDHDAVVILMECFSEHLNKGGQIILTSHQTIPLQKNQCQEYCL